ncbi:MAG TPA: ECF-type sigma factor [Longimicrobiales bacterium]
MTELDRGEITRLLVAWGEGDEAAMDRLMPLVYAELHGIARRHMRDERARTLQTTALVHEAYIRLAGADVAWEGRRHFLAIAARTMRRVLVDHARARQREKRGGAAEPVTLIDAPGPDARDPIDVIAIDGALEQLRALDERKAQSLELHYFAGLDYLQVADVLGIAPATVHRDIRFAKNWLYDRLRTD